VVDRFSSAVKFLDENIFSKLSAVAPFIAMVGGFLGKFIGSRVAAVIMAAARSRKRRQPNRNGSIAPGGRYGG